MLNQTSYQKDVNVLKNCKFIAKKICLGNLKASDVRTECKRFGFDSRLR